MDPLPTYTAEQLQFIGKQGGIDILTVNLDDISSQTPEALQAQVTRAYDHLCQGEERIPRLYLSTESHTVEDLRLGIQKIFATALLIKAVKSELPVPDISLTINDGSGMDPSSIMDSLDDEILVGKRKYTADNKVDWFSPRSSIQDFPAARLIEGTHRDDDYAISEYLVLESLDNLATICSVTLRIIKISPELITLGNSPETSQEVSEDLREEFLITILPDGNVRLGHSSQKVHNPDLVIDHQSVSKILESAKNGQDLIDQTISHIQGH